MFSLVLVEACRKN